MQSRITELVNNQEWLAAAKLMIELDERSYIWEDNLKIEKRHGENK